MGAGLAEDSPLIPVTDVLLTAPGTAGTWRQPGEAGGRAASVWWPWFLVMDLHVAPVMG